jgi:cell wall-associated NlpC family hydrolase
MMGKTLGSAILSATLVVGLALPAAALPSTDGPTPTNQSGQASVLQTSALAPAAAAQLRPRLTLGSRSPAVAYVQQQLGVRPASGYYGTLTRTAVKKLQRAKGVKVTGRVDAATWRVLLAAGTTDPTEAAAASPEEAAALRPTLALGARTPAVVHVQRRLGVTPTSGYYGPLTRSAVMALQQHHGLPATGEVDAATWDVILAGTGVIVLRPASDGLASPAGPSAPAAEVPSTIDAPAPPAAPTTPDPGPTTSPLTPEQAAATTPLLKSGMGPGDPAVTYVQTFLRVTPTTGYFGTLTKGAVTAYQKALGISATGNVGPKTWAAILAGRTAPTAQATAVSPPATAPTSRSTAPSAPAGPPPGTPTYELPADPAAREVALVYALAQVGKRYVLGGNGPEVFDCSGLVQQAYLSAGVRLPRLASQQRFAGTKVGLDQLLPGDLLYYQDGSSVRKGHISMYVGNGLAVEAANPRRGVRVRPLDEAWYRDRFVAAVRIG